jgi:hypothetical protein
MKNALATWLVSCLCLSANAAETHIFLPVHYAHDHQQSCQITLPNLPSGSWELKTPCYVHAVPQISSDSPTIDLLIDLDRQNETFHLDIFPLGSSTQDPVKVYTCHISLTPRPYILHQEGSTFSITNVSNSGFTVTQHENIDDFTNTPFIITGKLNSTGSLVIKDIGRITLNPR